MTRIYKSYDDFLNRENKEENGVSEGFAKRHPDFEEDNKLNEGCWDCDDCHGCDDCDDCHDCHGCHGCYNCHGCHDCDNCDNCTDCYGLLDRLGSSGHKLAIDIPKIDNIHQKVLEATMEEGALDMDEWHTCETTHCRAGWVVHLAGEDGKKLEEKTDTPLAALLIYKKSSQIRVSPRRFYDSEYIAMRDIERCAREEVELC